MIVLVAVLAWISALALIAGLCVAARRGDRAQLEYRTRARRRDAAAAAVAPPSV